jgi:hypothetical protein
MLKKTLILLTFLNLIKKKKINKKLNFKLKIVNEFMFDMNRKLTKVYINKRIIMICLKQGR